MPLLIVDDIKNLIHLKKNKKYINPYSKRLKRSFWHIFLWKIGHYDNEPQAMESPGHFSYPLKEHTYDEKKPFAAWINHSTFYVKAGGVHILTDPVWSKYCSPLSFFGPKRRHPPSLSLAEIPQVDYVIISHNHYDHLDKRTVRKLKRLFPDITWVVPLGLKKWFQKNNIYNVHELDWWETKKLSHQFQVTAVPAQHFSGRSGFDFNKTLWNGYIAEMQIESQKTKTLYFVGDTGYNPYDFKKIGKTWENIDLSLIPIGTYLPRGFMRAVHVDPKEAVQIHSDVGSQFSIGMHWKTFHLSDEPLDLPPYELYLAMEEAKLSLDNFVALQPGVYVNW